MHKNTRFFVDRSISVDIYIEDKVEACIASHFSRIANVFYWRSQTEVDVIAEFHNKNSLGIEVKWSKRVRKKSRYMSKDFELITLKKNEIPIFLANHS